MTTLIATMNANTYELLSELSDQLTESIISVKYLQYQKLSSTEQAQAKSNFFDSLKNSNIIITPELIQAAQTEFVGSPMPAMLQEYASSTQTNSIYSKAVNELTEGRKVTIIKFSEFGFPVSHNTTIDHVEVAPYAQHKESLNIIHKPKGKRKLWSSLTLPKDELIVYDGWLDIDIKKISNVVIRETESMAMTQSKYCSFDRKFIIDVLDSVEAEPIVYITSGY